MFSKKPQAPQRNSPAPRPATASTFSVLGSDVSIKGDVAATAELHIDGNVEGDISCATLVQGESSEITGSVTVETARLAGAINGSISARELVIMRSARIRGDVHYEALTIEQGAQVQGQFAQRSTKAVSFAAVSGSEEPKLILASSTS